MELKVTVEFIMLEDAVSGFPEISFFEGEPCHIVENLG
jgi:hypothetical protein